MPLDFPNPPLTIGQTWIGSNGVEYIWDGTKWVASGIPGGTGTFLPLAGGTMQGPISNLLVATTPVPSDLGVVTVDTDMLRAYGYSGGGTGALLSSKYATLAAAQAVYPHANSLSNSLDWAAIQGWYNAVANEPAYNGVVILLPPGDTWINQPIVTGAKAVVFRGAGNLATRILCTAGGFDFFQHTSTAAMIGFEMFDLGLYAAVAGCGYAINISQDMNTGYFRLDNVRFGSFSAAFSWKGYVLAEGTTQCYFHDVYATGGEFDDNSADWPSLTQIGFQFNSPDNNHKSFVFYFDDCYIGAIQHAVFVNITGVPGNSGSVEGMIFKNCNGRTVTSSWLRVAVTNSQGVWQPPYYVFDNCNLQSPVTMLDADGIAELHIKDCLLYLEAPSAGQPAGNYLNLTNVYEAYINNNTFATFTGVVVNNFIWIGPHSQNVVIENNTFWISATPITINHAGIACDSTATNIRVRNNVYFGSWPSGVPYEIDGAGGGGGNRFDMSYSNRFVISNGHGPALQLLDAGNPVANYLAIQPAGTGSMPGLYSEGSDANVSLSVTPKGSGILYLNGIIQGNSNWYVGGAGIGQVGFSPGDATHAGMVAFYNNSGVRVGYVGYGDGGANLVFAAAAPVTGFLLQGIVTTEGPNGQLNIGGTASPNIRSGTGAPSTTQPDGSLYLRADGTTGARLYVSAGGGTWTAVAGV